jgi:dienelactone hydrolase
MPQMHQAALLTRPWTVCCRARDDGDFVWNRESCLVARPDSGPHGGGFRHRALVALSAVAVVATATAAEPTFRIEVHPIPTMDLTTAEVLAGKSEGTARTIAGELRFPVTTAARVPAVIVMHGDAGAVANQVTWIAELNAIGVAVFTVDSFSGRGTLARTPGLPVEGAGAHSSTARVVDAYRALAVLAKHPRIDASRIALMGVSSGGRVAINAAMTRFSKPFSPADAGFAAFIALYPPCNIKLKGDTDLVAAPLRIHHGSNDVITRSEACRAYVERLLAAGRDADFAEYAGAQHGYDSPAGMPSMQAPQAPNPSRCEYEERADGWLVNAATGKPVTLNDECVGIGLASASNPQAAAATQAAVKSFLRKVFKLSP